MSVRPDTPEEDATIPDDIKKRDTLIFGDPIEWCPLWSEGGTRLFDEPLSVAVARELIENDHMSPEGTQNGGPSMETLVEVGEEIADNHPEVTVEFTGYAISPFRPDPRVRLTGITVTSEGELPQPVKELFDSEFGPRYEVSDKPYCGADNFETAADYRRAWWD